MNLYVKEQVFTKKLQFVISFVFCYENTKKLL